MITRSHLCVHGGEERRQARVLSEESKGYDKPVTPVSAHRGKE